MARWIRPNTRLAIYDRDGFACIYCGRGVEDKITLSLDHIITRSMYRSLGLRVDNSSRNLITACRSCNSKRRDTKINEFAPHLMDKINLQLSLDLRPHLLKARRIIANRQ